MTQAVPNTIFYIFFSVTAAMGAICVVAPEKVMSYRRSRSWGNSWITGGVFYATAGRTRLAGVLITIFSLLALILGPS